MKMRTRFSNQGATRAGRAVAVEYISSAYHFCLDCAKVFFKDPFVFLFEDTVHSTINQHALETASEVAIHRCKTNGP